MTQEQQRSNRTTVKYIITNNSHFSNDLLIPDSDFKGNILFSIAIKCYLSGLINCIFNVYNMLSLPAAVEDI